MPITTADVNKIICLFYLKVTELVDSDSYGVECDQDELLKEIKKLLKHYELNCYYSDFIREYVEDNEDFLESCSSRLTITDGIPG